MIDEVLRNNAMTVDLLRRFVADVTVGDQQDGSHNRRSRLFLKDTSHY